MILKSDAREFGELSPNHSKVCKFHFDGLFLSKVLRFEIKNTEELSFMTLNSDVKLE